MSTNMNQAGFMSAVAQGAQGLTQGIESRPAAQLAKKQAEEQMSQIDTRSEADIYKAQVEEAKGVAQEATRKLQKENMFRGLRYFTEDQNPRHLNALLQGGPMSKSGIIRFAKIDPNADKALMANSGLDMEDATGMDLGNEHIGDNARFVKGVMQDGSEKIFDVYKVKQMTGYFKNVTDQEMERELALNEKYKGYSPSEWEKKASFVESMGVDTKKGATQALYNDMKTGNTGGKVELAEQTEENLDKTFDGSFVANFDPTNEEHRKAAEQQVEKIEAMRGIKWSATELKDLNDLSVLIGLGQPGGALSDDETGFWDNTLFNVKKYFFDEGGSGANEAYAAYRNSLRNALYGSALTEHEIAAFNEQLGSLKMQRGPLVQQMMSSMNQVKSKLDNIYNMNNSYSATYRLGVNRTRLATIIGALETNMQRIKDLESGKATGKTKEQRVNDLKSKL